MNTPAKSQSERILSIDIMRGLTLVLMLFVNDLFAPGVPEWLLHTKADFDGMGLSDWVFPGFLFMVGMAIPFAIENRRKKGASNLNITKHILIRTVSLLFIGVLLDGNVPFIVVTGLLVGLLLKPAGSKPITCGRRLNCLGTGHGGLNRPKYVLSGLTA